MPTATKQLSINEIQGELANLDGEEAGIPARIEAKTLDLAKTRQMGDFQKAAVLAQEIEYLSGPRVEAIKEGRKELKRRLWDALAIEMERQAAEIGARAEAQKAKEDEARAVLEQVSGCEWQPTVDPKEIFGIQRYVRQTPLSEQWEGQANYRKRLAGWLHAPNPERLHDSPREALKLIEKPE
jgi:hypothetical protein